MIRNALISKSVAFHKTCTDNKDVCNIFGNIPKTKVRYMPLLYQQSKTPPLPEATWGIRILVVCNKAAREQLITNNPSSFDKIKHDLSPATIWSYKNTGTIPFFQSPTERLLPRMAKSCRLPNDPLAKEQSY